MQIYKQKTVAYSNICARQCHHDETLSVNGELVVRLYWAGLHKFLTNGFLKVRRTDFFKFRLTDFCQISSAEFYVIRRIASVGGQSIYYLTQTSVTTVTIVPSNETCGKIFGWRNHFCSYMTNERPKIVLRFITYETKTIVPSNKTCGKIFGWRKYGGENNQTTAFFITDKIPNYHMY